LITEEQVQLKETETFKLLGNDSRYAKQPWRALLIIIGIQPICLVLTGSILYGIFKQPKEFSNIESFSTAILFTVSNFLAYLILPFFLRIPNGKRTFKDYLRDIGLTKIHPFIKLLILTFSCLLILIICQGSGSIVYRLTEGEPLTLSFIGEVYNLSLSLPLKSMLLFTVFYSVFEEVGFRGVFLTMLLRKHSQRNAIIYSALAFGLVHIFSAFAGRAFILAIAQVIWASLFGLFYGYIFVKTGSLLPSMIIHWLINVFQAPLTAYQLTAPIMERALYGIVFGYGLATILLIFWVSYFSSRWINSQKPAINS
jgi:membrane protease YdiL (CAAX protease family)